MQGILLVIVLAIVVEAVVEYIKSLANLAISHEWKTAALQIAALAVSVLLCFMTGADLFVALGLEFRSGWIGVLLTGIFASRGANYVSDFVGRLRTTTANA